jgi:hypothetical protein
VPEHETNLLGLAQIREPVPGEQALTADHEVGAKGRDGREERLRPAREIPVENGLAGSVQDADKH